MEDPFSQIRSHISILKAWLMKLSLAIVFEGEVLLTKLKLGLKLALVN